MKIVSEIFGRSKTTPKVKLNRSGIAWTVSCVMVLLLLDQQSNISLMSPQWLSNVTGS